MSDIEIKDIKEAIQELNAKGLKATYEDLDTLANIEDFFMDKGRIGTKCSYHLCSRLCDVLGRWVELYHRFLLPNTGSLIAIEESKLFNDTDKEVITDLLYKMMYLISANTKLAINPNKEDEIKLIDAIIEFWKNNKAIINEHVNRINTMWKERTKKKVERPSYSG
ncbi:MAG: hypothetical protein ACMXYK_02490 [Candidatus Woesearchaeota archaeon]